MNDKELALRTLIDAKVLMYTSDDALDKTTAAIYAWHTRKLNEAVRDAMNDAKREIYEDCTLDEVIEAARALGIIDRRIAELEGKL